MYMYDYVYALLRANTQNVNEYNKAEHVSVLIKGMSAFLSHERDLKSWGITAL